MILRPFANNQWLFMVTENKHEAFNTLLTWYSRCLPLSSFYDLLPLPLDRFGLHISLVWMIPNFTFMAWDQAPCMCGTWFLLSAQLISILSTKQVDGWLLLPYYLFQFHPIPCVPTYGGCICLTSTLENFKITFNGLMNLGFVQPDIKKRPLISIWLASLAERGKGNGSRRADILVTIRSCWIWYSFWCIWSSSSQVPVLICLCTDFK